MSFQMPMRSIRFNAVMNGIKTISSMIFPLITFPYVSRILGPEGTGKINFAWTFVGYFVLVATIGIPYYGVREIARIRDERDRMADLTQELLVLHLGASLIATLAFFFAVFVSGKLAQEPSLYLVVGTSILLSAAGMEWLYQGREEDAYIPTRSLLFSVVSMGALFLFVHGKGDYVIYAAIGVAASLGSCIMNFWNARSIISSKRSSPWQFRRHFGFIGTVYVMGLISSLYLSADVLFLGFMKDDRQVGIYSASTKLTKLVATLIASAGAVLMPRLSYYAEKGMDMEYRRTLGKSIAVTLLFSLPCVAGLVLLSREIIAVFAGHQYAESAHCIVITAPVILLSSISNILAWQVLYPKSGERKILVAMIAGAVVACFLNFFLVRVWGYSGAAFALFFSEVAVFIFLWIPSRSGLEGAGILRSCASPFLATIGMLVFLLLLRIWNLGNFSHLAVGVAGGGVVYMGILLLLKDPLAQELKELVFKRFGKAVGA